MKTIVTLLSITFSTSLFAIDITPYKEGQSLNNKQASELQLRYKNRKQQPWKELSSSDTIKTHKNAALIQYGIQVLDKTAITIGPNSKDKTKRYSGNALNCTNCHLKGASQLPGTKYDAIPFINIVNDYPQFRSRGMSVVNAAARTNGCMTRSMGNGKELPLDSKEMKGILAYYDWLAEGTENNLAMDGTGVPALKLPDRKADVIAGKNIYQKSCLACHGNKGLGTKTPDFSSTGNYTFPPLAGNDSFNNGAGMSRLIKASQFIHANMPLGASSKTPTLTIEQSYDVAAYILSLPRQNKTGRENDFPDKDFRPADYPVPAYFKDDKAALEKATLGPY